MIKRKQIPSLAGGLNNVTRSDIIGDNQTQICKNFELNKAGILTRRKAPEEYDADLQTKIDTLGELQDFCVWYPNNLPSDIDSDTNILYVCYILPDGGGDYQLHVVYLNNSGSYANEQITISDINYTGSSSLTFVESPDKMIILDWDGDNGAHFVAYDTDGNLHAGKMGIEAPKAKPDVSQITDWNPSDWEEDASQDRMCQCGLIQFVYICVTEDGEYSNPSPISDTLDMQFFKVSQDLETERWVNKVSISNLSIPDTDGFTKDKLKYFNIYYRFVNYSESLNAGFFYFSQQFKIVDKENIDIDTGNNYEITVENTGEEVSWENDIAPVADCGVSVAGIPILGSIKQKINFPFDFQYYLPIELTNSNSKTFIDAVIRIRLNESDIDHLDLSNYESGGVFNNQEHIRFYDSDLTTPIAVYCADLSTISSDYIDLYIKIPQLSGKQVHTIYLCFTSDLGEYVGVNISKYEDAEYGEWADNWSNQAVFPVGTKVNENSMISSGFVIDEYSDPQDNVTNKANTNANGSVTGSVHLRSGTPVLLPSPISSFQNNPRQIKLHGDGDDDYVKYDMYKTFPEKGFISFWTKFDPDDIDTHPMSHPYTDVYYLGILADIRMTDDEFIKFGLTDRCPEGDCNLHFALYVDKNDDWDKYIFENISIGCNLGPYEKYILLSWKYVDDNNLEFHLFFYGTSGVSWKTDSVTVDPKDVEPGKDIDVYIGDITERCCDAWEANDDYNEYLVSKSIPNAYYGNFLMGSGKFFDSGDANEVNQVHNMASLMPPFETFIGYDYTNHNKKISFGEVRSVEYKVYKNRIIWGEVNGLGFPDLNYRDIKGEILATTQAPFLQSGGQYTNTIIVWTRNRVYRFILTQNEGNWSASAENMIQEKEGYGLYAPKSLARDGNAYYWLAEVGVCRLSGNGLEVISDAQGNKRINLGTLEEADNYIGFMNRKNRQYILHRQDIQSQGFLLTSEGEKIETSDGYYVVYD